jgi:hypothetical protein
MRGPSCFTIHVPTMKRPVPWLFACALLCGGNIARAQDAPAESTTTEASVETPPPEPATVPAAPATERIAVLLLPSGEVDASVADALTELLIAAVAERGGATIVGKEEFQSQLGQGDASTAECLESVTCLGRIGVALGVREVIAGTIGHHGTTWSFALNRIDVRSGATEGRVFREVEGDLGAVVRSLPQSVDDLYVEVVRPGRLVVRADAEGAEVSLDGAVIGSVIGGEPVRRDLIAPGRHEVVVRAGGRASYQRTIDIEAGTTFALEAELAVLPQRGFEVPVVTWVLGGVAFASLAAGIGLGVSSSAHAPDAASMRTVQSFYAARSNEAIGADVCFGLAAAATAGAVIPLILALTSRPSTDAPTVSLAPSPTGAYLAITGSF